MLCAVVTAFSLELQLSLLEAQDNLKILLDFLQSLRTIDARESSYIRATEHSLHVVLQHTELYKLIIHEHQLYLVLLLFGLCHNLFVVLRNRDVDSLTAQARMGLTYARARIIPRHLVLRLQ